MKDYIGRRTRMREAAREKAKEYLSGVTDDYGLVISAVAEMLWEDFGVKTEISENLAKNLIDPIWDDIVAEANIESQEADDFYRSREEARMGAY